MHRNQDGVKTNTGMVLSLPDSAVVHPIYSGYCRSSYKLGTMGLASQSVDDGLGIGGRYFQQRLCGAFWASTSLLPILER